MRNVIRFTVPVVAAGLLLSACSGGNSSQAVSACEKAGQAQAALMQGDLSGAKSLILDAERDAFAASEVTTKHEALLSALGQVEQATGTNGLDGTSFSMRIGSAMAAVAGECQAIGVNW